MNALLKTIIADAENICQGVDFSEIQDKEILVTGASGLIGTYILACLKYLNDSSFAKFKVTAVVQNDLPDYFMELIDYGGANICRGDLTDYSFCQSLPKADFIIHAAGYGQPGKFMEDQVKTIKLNTFSTFLLFEKLNLQGKFLFISSSEVYSGLLDPPYNESQIGITNTTHQRSCYIEAKRCGEAIVNAYRHRGISAKSARLSLAYGPGTKPGDKRVINNFIFKALQGKIDLLDKGEAKRTYCYVSDAVEILWQILFNGKESIYNVGGDSKITIADLAKKIGALTNASVDFPAVSANALVGAPEDVCLDMTLVKSEFGKNNYVRLDEGLLKTIDWQRLLYKIIK